jgi:hypothetical protein
MNGLDINIYIADGIYNESVIIDIVGRRIFLHGNTNNKEAV